MKHTSKISATIAAILSASAAQAVSAQTVEPAAPASVADSTTTQGGTQLQEVVVTAERRSENIQDVPVTIQALTGGTLSDLNVQTADDLFRYVPNLSMGNNGPGQSNYYMRGLSTGDRSTVNSGTVGEFPNVAVYLDDQSVQMPSHNLDIYAVDLERVEVLEGPQGTLFGGGAEAGVIRYITNKPDPNKFEGTADAQYSVTAGGDPNTAVSAVVNVPILRGKMAFRGVVYSDDEGGYINNVASTFTRQNTDVGIHYADYPAVNGQCPNGLPNSGFCVPPGSPSITNQNLVQPAFNPARYQGARAELLTQFTDDWSLLISQMYQTLHTDGVFYSQPENSAGTALGADETSIFNPSWDDDSFENTAVTVKGKVWDLNVLYTGAYLNRRVDTQSDYTNYARGVYADYYQCYGANPAQGIKSTCFSPSAYWDEYQKNTHQSHELRVSTPDEWRWRGIAGAYWERYSIDDLGDWFYKSIPACTDSLTVGCLSDVAPPPGSVSNNPSVRPDNESFASDVQRGYTQTAFYASTNFDIIPKVLTISAGTRHYDYGMNMAGSVLSSFGCYEAGRGPCYGTPIADPSISGTTGLRSSYSGFKSRADLTWHVTANIMAYFTWSQGYRPGGFNRNTGGTLNGTATYTNSSGTVQNIPQYIKPLYYAPDSLTNYELGFKSVLLDHRLFANVSIYDEEWKNAQVLLFDPSEFGNLTFTTNGPDYQVHGIELQLSAMPIEGLTLTASGAWNEDTQTNSPLLIDNNHGQLPGIPASPTAGQPITQFESPGGTGLASALNPFGATGQTTALSPAAEWNLRARYSWAIGEKYLPYVQIAVTHTDHYYNQTATSPNGAGVTIITTNQLRYNIPSYSVVDAAFGVTEGNYNFEIYGQNLANNDASTFTSSADFAESEVPLRPRIIGVHATVQF